MSGAAACKASTTSQPLEIDVLPIREKISSETVGPSCVRDPEVDAEVGCSKTNATAASRPSALPCVLFGPLRAATTGRYLAERSMLSQAPLNFQFLIPAAGSQPRKSHLYCLLAIWVRLCLAKLHRPAIAYPQPRKSHLYGLSPVWARLCLSKLLN